MTTCPNLKELYGNRFKVEYEQSYFAEHGQRGRTEEPWLMILLCQRGHICPWGPDTLAASTNKHGPVAKRLAAMDCCKVVQDASDGVTVRFHVDNFKAVAALMKPRRRRRLTPEQRAAAVERLRKYAFTAAAQAPENEQSGVSGPLPDSQVVQDDLRPAFVPETTFDAAALS